MRRLTAILKVRPEEGRLALLVGLLFLCIQAAQGLGDNAASALFFLRFGVDNLPYMYVLLGATTVLLTLGYAAMLGRYDQRRFFAALLLGTALVVLVERLALVRPFPLLYPILWLTISCMGMILGTFVWNVAGEVTDTRQAKRLFPLYTSAGILGSVAGNTITGMLAKRLGTDNLLILVAALVGASFFLTRSITRDYFPPFKRSGKPASFWSDTRTGYDFVRGSELMRLVAYASVLFSIIYFAMAFPFNKVVTASFPDEASVAGYLGLFTGITTAVTFVVSLLLANRIYARLGIVNSVLILPLTYLLGFVVFAGLYSLNGAAFARFTQMVVLSGVAGTAWSALFNVVPSQKRGQVLAFENGPPSQLGVALSGLLLILGDRVLSATQILMMGSAVTIACGYMVWRMRRAYGEALVQALRAGRLEVFTADGVGFSGLQSDAAALQVLTQALQDPKPTTRRLAAQILRKMGNPSAAEALAAAASDPDAGVRAAAVAALGSLKPDAAKDTIAGALDDPDAEVRRQALHVLASAGPRAAEPARLRLEELLNDPDLSVRMQAVTVLARLGEADKASRSLHQALQERDVRVREAALETFGAVAPYLDGKLDAAPVVRLLADTLSAVRVAACHALGSLHDPGSAQALVTRLHDGDVEVRKAAANSLRRRGPEAAGFVLSVLDSEFEAAQEAALDALLPGTVQSSDRLRRFARVENERFRTLREQEASLPSGGRAVAMLCDSLRYEIRLRENRLVKIVGLIGNQRAMSLVQESLASGDAEARAAALEALETLGDKALAHEIIAVLEAEPRRSSTTAVISQLLDSGQRWDRALAIRSVQELGLRELMESIQGFMLDRDPLIAETAAEALVRLGEERPMNTLQTVSTLERVLLLREVPIFSDLSPEDLQRIAAIASEQWFPKDTTVFRQGEEGNMMYILVDGQVQVVRSTNGNEQVLAERGPGDFVGEMAIIESAPRSASLVTQGDVRVLAIDGQTFKGILRERPDVSLAVLRSLSRRLRER